MGLHHHIGVVCLGEGLHRLCDGVGVGLVEQPAVTVVRVNDRPVVWVGDLALSEPTEALKLLPVPSRFLGGIFQGHFTHMVMVISVVRGVLSHTPFVGVRSCCGKDGPFGRKVV